MQHDWIINLYGVPGLSRMLFVVCRSESVCMGTYCCGSNAYAGGDAVWGEGPWPQLFSWCSPNRRDENCDKMGTPSSYCGAPAAAGAPLVGHQLQLPGDQAEKREQTKQKEDTRAPPDTALRGLELLVSRLELIFLLFETILHGEMRCSRTPLTKMWNIQIKIIALRQACSNERACASICHKWLHKTYHFSNLLLTNRRANIQQLQLGFTAFNSTLLLEVMKGCSDIYNWPASRSATLFLFPLQLFWQDSENNQHS